MSQYNFADLSFPGAPWDWATGINDLGQIVGYYPGGDPEAPFFDYSAIGFLYSGGTFTAVSYPAPIIQGDILVADHARITEPTAINDAGAIVGTWSWGSHLSTGFLYSGGTYTPLL